MTEEFKEFEQHALDDAIANGVNASEVQARCQDMARKISYFCLAMGKHTLIFGHRCPVRALLWPASPRTRSVHYCRLQCIWINGRRTWHGSHLSLRSLSVLPIWCLVVNGTPPPPFLRYSKWSLRGLRDWSKGQNLEAKCFSGEEHTDLVGCHLKRNLWDMYLCRAETIDKDIETVGKPLSWLLRLHPVLISCSSPAAP